MTKSMIAKPIDFGQWQMLLFPKREGSLAKPPKSFNRDRQQREYSLDLVLSAMNIFDLYFPYCIKRLSDDIVIILNRHYLPLGWDRKYCKWAQYELCPGQIKIPLSWEQLAKYFDYSLAPETSDRIYLYGPSTQPIVLGYRFVMKNWIAYVSKLTKLIGLNPQKEETPADETGALKMNEVDFLPQSKGVNYRLQ